MGLIQRHTKDITLDIPTSKWERVVANVHQKQSPTDSGVTKMPPAKPPESHCSAANFIPEEPTSLQKLAAAAADCRGCHLYEHATQTVFGAGAAHARIVFVGEQPGDAEDKTGQPFVGPAGKLFDKALIAAGISREETYVTNAVKHFKYQLKGKRRLHDKPRRIEVQACLPWLLAELEQIKPDLVVCLGATAAQALMGHNFKVTQHRGEFFPSTYAPRIMATVHPSSILRARDDETRHQEFERFVEDLRQLNDAKLRSNDGVKKDAKTTRVRRIKADRDRLSS